jgi:hypothetical protein
MRKGMKLLAVVALVGIMVLGSAVAALAGPVTFGASGVMEKVGDGDSVWSEGMRNLAFQTTAVDGPALYAVWSERVGGESVIKFAKGLDNGREWREERIIANSPAGIADNTIDVSADGPNGKGTIHVVYGVNGIAVYYISSVDGGLTWSAPVNVVASMPEYGTNYAFSIAADGAGNVYIATNPGGYGLPTLVAASADGLNWGLYQIPGTEASMEPVIDTSPSGNVYVVSCRSSFEPLFSKSTNGGQSWSTVALPQHSNNSTIGIAVKDDLNIYISMGSWNDLVVAYTHNGGAQAADWTFVTVVDQTSGNISTSLALSPSGDPNVSWVGSDGWVRLSRGKNGGTSWTTYSIPGVNPYWQSLAVDADGKAHIMFDWGWPDGSTIQITHEQ